MEPFHNWRLHAKTGVRYNFCTLYQVADWFLKSESHIESTNDQQNGTQMQAAYIILKKTSYNNWSVIWYPAMKAILDAFGQMVHSIERFETSVQPIRHIALPKSIVCCRLGRHCAWESDVAWWRKSMGSTLSLLQSAQQCSSQKISEKLMDHSLLVVDCYLNPLSTETEFISYGRTRMYCHSKA